MYSLTKLLRLLLLLPSIALATPEQEQILNSLTQAEGTQLVEALVVDNQVTSILLNNYHVVIYPTSTPNHLCRNTLFLTNTSKVQITACKVSGDWIFMYD